MLKNQKQAVLLTLLLIAAGAGSLLLLTLFPDPDSACKDIAARAQGGLFEGHKIGAITPFKVEKVALLSNQEAEARLKLTTGLPPDAPVCYLRLHGTFGMGSPFTTNVTTWDYVFQLFNAKTKTLLVVGQDS